MGTMTDLRSKAAELRGMRPSSSQPAPDKGEILARCTREDGTELLVAWREFDGHNYMDIRIWRGDWPIKGKGISIRLKEIADLAEGVAVAVDRTMDSQRAWLQSRGEGQGRGGGHSSRPSQARPSERREEAPLWEGEEPPPMDEMF